MTHKGLEGGCRQKDAASDEVDDLSDFSEVWQAKGLVVEGQELAEGALTGGAGRGTIPTDMSLL